MLADSPRAGDGQPALPRRREPDLARLAAFTLDPAGLVVSWPVSATTLFGYQARTVMGWHVCEVLMTGPGHRTLVENALAAVAAGQVWSATVAGGRLGDGRFAFRWEPMAGPDGAVLVIAHRAWPQPAPSWLAEAATRIGSSLDLAQTAAEVAEAAVAGFADAAVIYAAERLLAADDLDPYSSSRAGLGSAVRRLAARLAGHGETVTSSLLPAGEVLFPGTDTPRSQVMATGQPVLSAEPESEAAQRLARDPVGQEIVDAYTSFLTMPLTARGAVVGCAVFARTPASPAFDPDDITLAGELASRAAVCIDNARLYARERRTAQALQRGLLPGEPNIPPGIEVAHLYLPVGDNVVGGDWHDIVPLPGGRAALIVGDAMGHGPEAAAVMVQLRTAAHTLAELDLPPTEVLSRLDAMAARLDVTAARDTAAPFATCVYAVIDPSGGGAEIARAGHLPPLLAPPAGPPRELDLPPGLPLGLGADSFQAVRFPLPPGTTLALFTDGLVESRTRPIDDGLAALRQALSATLAAPGVTLNQACHTIGQQLREHGEDDMTLLLART